MKRESSLPSWLKKKLPKGKIQKNFRLLLNNPNLHTVCEEALCPNRGECFSLGRATFLILGKVCTRNCSFCAISKGKPEPVNPREPEEIGAAVRKHKIKYAVITSVSRDDLPDGGASHFAETIFYIKKLNPNTKVEVLIPDFSGNLESLKTVLKAGPFVLNHNLETVPRLYPKIRPEANFYRSLKILKFSKKIAPEVFTKSGLMLGLGERKEEVLEVMRKLKEANCDFLTLGQYLQPSPKHAKIYQYITPETFKELEKEGLNLGFKKVFSGFWVRSSYLAEEFFKY